MKPTAKATATAKPAKAAVAAVAPEGTTDNPTQAAPTSADDAAPVTTASEVTSRMSSLLANVNDEEQPADPIAEGQEPPPEAPGAEDDQTDPSDQSDPPDDPEEAASAAEEEEEEPEAHRGWQKRVDTLTARNSELKEKVTTLESQLQEQEAELTQLRETQPRQVSQAGRFSEITTTAALQQKQQEVQQVADWVEDQMTRLRTNPDAVARELKQNGIKLGSDGEDGEDYSPERMEEWLMATRRNARESIREHLPKRAAYIEQAAAWEQEAVKQFPWWKDRNSADYALAQKVIQAFPEIRNRPDWKFSVAVQVLGLKALQAQRAASTKPAATSPAPKLPAKGALQPNRTNPRGAAIAAAAAGMREGRRSSVEDYLRETLP